MPSRSPFPFALLLVLLLFSRSASASAIERAEFTRLVTEISEPEGYFDTDNLISNETTFLDVTGALEALRGHDGVYIGVGPDQNFSYLAHLRPSVAFLVDIRRGNLLEHLLFRALFDQAQNRIEYLSLLIGRPAPADAASWNARPVTDLVRYLDAAAPDPAAHQRTARQLRARIAGYGIPVSAEDLDQIARIHERFVASGLDLQFNSHGRAPRSYYPRLRDLITARDLAGRPASYLAAEDHFQFLKRMHAENRIIPIVGNLAGPKALARIGSYARERGLTISAIYTSNVEQYLEQDGTLGRFASNLAALPSDGRSLVIRSSFGWYARSRPRGNSYSTQLVQPLTAFLEGWRSGDLRSYSAILNASRPAVIP